MGLLLETSMPVLTMFLQGLLGFLPSCILPLVPPYASYLAGGTRDVNSDGNIHYPRRRVLVNTLFSVAGINFIFFLLGFGFTALGSFFRSNQTWFACISGATTILFGLYQFDVFGRSDVLEREHRPPLRLDRWTMNPPVALVLGLTFSFAWTPCVDPTLGSILLMASPMGSTARGFLLITVYTLDSVIPPLVVRLFTGAVLGFFKHHQRVVRYTVKVGVVLLVLTSIMTLTGFMNGTTSYLSSAAGSGVAETPQAQTSGAPDSTPGGSTPAGPEESPVANGRPVTPAPGFTLVGQYGEERTLSDYEDRAVSLNFWAVWCGSCKREMSETQTLYGEYRSSEEDVIVLGVVNLRSEGYPYNRDVTQSEMEQFLENSGYTSPVAIGVIGEVFYPYGTSVFPTIFMIGANGNVFGYVPGTPTGDMMEFIVQQTIDGVETRV